MHAVPMCTKLYAWNGCTTHVDTHSIMKCTFSHSCAISFIYYVYSHFLFTNRFLVNLTAFLKEIIKDIKEMWSEMVPKIFDATKNESNAKLKSLYEESITCTSEGMARYYIIIIVAYYLAFCRM